MSELNLQGLTSAQLTEIADLLELEKEAQRLYDTVIKLQKVGLSDDKHIVWKNEHNQEYLIRESNGWVWVAEYLHQYYRVWISKESIFDVMKRGYYFGKDPDNRSRTNQSQEAVGYFKAYVDGLERNAEGQK